MQDAISKGKASQFRIRHCAHDLPQSVVTKAFDLIGGRSPWALSRYLNQGNAFLDKEKIGPFASVTALAISIVSFLSIVHGLSTETLQGVHRDARL